MSDDAGGDQATNNGQQQNNTQTSVNIPAKMIAHFKANRVDGAMWATRLLTVIFAVFYVLPIFG